MKSAQETLIGWGIHVEMIEIEDVQIINNTLFKHMQTEFRDAQNLKATEIRYMTECAERDERLEKDQTYNMKATEMQSQTEKIEIELKEDTTKVQNQLETDRMKAKLELINAAHETKMLTAAGKMKITSLQKEQEHSSRMAELKLEHEMASDNLMQKKWIE